MCCSKYVSALFLTPVLMTALTFQYNTPGNLNLPTFPCYPVVSFHLQETVIDGGFYTQPAGNRKWHICF